MSPLTNDPGCNIPVDVAAEWTANWRNYLNSSAQAFNVQAFSIPIECIKNILLFNENADAIRAYIGLEIADDVSSAKLVLVPSIGDTDIVYLPANSDKGGDNSNVYDNTLTCPPYCAVKNPLNG